MSIIKKIRNKLKRDGLIKTSITALRYPFAKGFRILKDRVAKRRATKRRAENKKNILKKISLSERFNEIYEKSFWSSNESLSGEGSEINYTRSLRVWLVKRLPELNIRTFVDAPCGDFNWMKVVLPEVNVNYFGFDIVKSVIKNNNQLYANEKIKFAIANICEDKLPSCDILMVRDCLFHLSYEDINKFLENINQVEYRYLLTTTHIVDSSFTNKNIVSGDFRLIDLFSYPFNFNEKLVVDRVKDFPKEYPVPREMILVKKEHVRTSIAHNM
jgi:hypothetical protein